MHYTIFSDLYKVLVINDLYERGKLQLISFSNFSCMFLHPNDFFPIWIIIVLFFEISETSRNKLKEHAVTKNYSDLSLFEQIVLVISKCLQILGLQPRISKVFFSITFEHFLLTNKMRFQTTSTNFQEWKITLKIRIFAIFGAFLSSDQNLVWMHNLKFKSWSDSTKETVFCGWYLIWHLKWRNWKE